MLVKAKDVLDAAQMSQDPEARFALLAEGLDDTVVAPPMGLEGLQRRNELRIYEADVTVKLFTVIMLMSIDT